MGAGYVADTARPTYLVDEHFDGALTNWSNVQQHAGGTATGRLYCGEKVSNAASVTYTYGSLPAYEPGRWYDLTWRQKVGSGVWEPKSEASRWIYYDTDVQYVTKEWAISSDALLIDQFRARLMTATERAQQIDQLLAQYFPNGGDAVNYPDDSHLALIPKAMAKLRSGGTLRVFLMGDSFRAGLNTVGVETLLMRAYPLCTVIPLGHFVGSTGADSPLVSDEGPPFYGWDSAGRISGWVASQSPDLVIFGGISSTYGRFPEWMPLADSIAHWDSVIAQLRALIPGVEIVVGSPANGQEGTEASPTLYSDYVRDIAVANNVAFYDEARDINRAFARAGTTAAYQYSPSPGPGDGTHYGVPGWVMDARCLAGWFRAL